MTACVSPKIFGVIGTVFLKGVPECGFGGVTGNLKTVKKNYVFRYTYGSSHFKGRVKEHVRGHFSVVHASCGVKLELCPFLSV